MLNNGGHHTCVARTLNRPRRNGKLWVRDCTLPPGLFLYGFAVASGGLSVQGSRFDVGCSTFGPQQARLRFLLSQFQLFPSLSRTPNRVSSDRKSTRLNSSHLGISYA